VLIPSGGYPDGISKKANLHKTAAISHQLLAVSKSLSGGFSLKAEG